MQTFSSPTIVRLFLAIFLIHTLITSAYALPSPSSSSLQPKSESHLGRSPLEFRGRAYNKARREHELSYARDVLFNKANDLRRAQRFRAAQKKKREAAVIENVLSRTLDGDDASPIVPAEEPSSNSSL